MSVSALGSLHKDPHLDQFPFPTPNDRTQIRNWEEGKKCEEKRRVSLEAGGWRLEGTSTTPLVPELTGSSLKRLGIGER